MDFNKIRKFAQDARDLLTNQISSKLEAVIKDGSSALRENESAVEKLKGQVSQLGASQVAEQVAYTWFNRFIALMYMDQNGFNSVQVVGSVPGSSRPEILSEAISGNIPSYAPSDKITSLLARQIPSANSHEEVYKLLLVSVCNNLSNLMPFMFEKIGDYTELLLPDDLLSKSSILSNLREVLTAENCQDVEIIGWLYQFYISKKKDQVFADLNDNIKISAENIPAATQLFTPHWIVRFLIENSLGRLWFLNNPNSKIVNHMKYFLATQDPALNFSKINRPEELSICDPACGSGHMLSYAFDLLYLIYEEVGYNASEIPALILSKNIYGMEIDDRAGALASFVLVMKAAKKIGWNKFVNMKIVPNICVYQDFTFSEDELREVKMMIGTQNFTDKFKSNLSKFENAKTFGSLIKSEFSDPTELLEQLKINNSSHDFFKTELRDRLMSLLITGHYLNKKFHIVVTNPPYLGNKGMKKEFSDFAKINYPISKIDLYAMFMESCISMLTQFGFLAMINMQSWMFIPKLVDLRKKIIRDSPPICMARLGRRGFDTISGGKVSTTAFVLGNSNSPNTKGVYVELKYGKNESEKNNLLIEALKNKQMQFIRKAKSFDLIPFSTLAFWASNAILESYNRPKLSDYFEGSGFNKTGDNNKYLRYMWEISLCKRGKDNKWVPYTKGGEFRKWYGNVEHVIDWSINAREFYLKNPSSCLILKQFWYRPGVSWTYLASNKNCFRYLPADSTYDANGLTIFPTNNSTEFNLLGLLNSPYAKEVLEIFNPKTISQSNIKTIPVPSQFQSIEIKECIKKLIDISQSDWDSLETSWGFSSLPLLASKFKSKNIGNSYGLLRNYWKAQTIEMQELEEKNNRTIIESYGLENEISPEIPINEITLNCNPEFKYRESLSSEKKEKLLLKDTITEFISYSVGCMFGRYSIESPGLIIASQGQTLNDYKKLNPNPIFNPDADNIIPILDDDWFADDLFENFRRFVQTVFGERELNGNLSFINKVLGKEIRQYFLKDFYDHHLKLYKKRPIYWMFSSPKGTFKALMYMHRYQSDTISVLLDSYLRELIRKLETKRSQLNKIASDTNEEQLNKTQAVTMLTKITNNINELKEWEREVILPLAQQRIEIDLDDGVKVNYQKFGTALQEIKGLGKTDA